MASHGPQFSDIQRYAGRLRNKLFPLLTKAGSLGPDGEGVFEQVRGEYIYLIGGSANPAPIQAVSYVLHPLGANSVTVLIGETTRLGNSFRTRISFICNEQLPDYFPSPQQEGLFRHERDFPSPFSSLLEILYEIQHWPLP